MQWLRRWAYSASGFNKLGLWHDDCLYEDEEVKEAVRRLPERLQDDRTFRITRAMQLSLTHQLLPKEQWTTYDEVGGQRIPGQRLSVLQCSSPLDNSHKHR